MEFEDKIKQLMDGVSETPDTAVWERISGTMARRAARARYFRRGIYSVVSVAAVALLLIFVDLGDKQVTPGTPQVKIALQSNENSSSTIAKETLPVNVKQLKQVKKIAISQTITNNPAVDVCPAANDIEVIAADKQETEVATPVENEQNRQQNQQLLKEQIKRSGNLKTASFDDYTPSAPKNRFNIGAYTHLGSSSQRSIAYMYSRGLDYDGSQTFMAMGASFEVESDTKYYAPASAGIQLQIPITPKLSIGTGAVYTYLRSDIITTVSEVNSSTVVTEIHYLGVPLNLYYNIISSKKLRFYANTGFMAEKGLVEDVRVIGTGNGDGNISTSIKPLALSANLGMGVEYLMSKNFGLYADPGIVYYFDTNQPISLRTVQQLQYKFEVGLRLHL